MGGHQTLHPWLSEGMMEGFGCLGTEAWSLSQKVWVHTPLPPFLSLGLWAGCSHPLLVSQVQSLQNEDALNPLQLEIS